MLSWAFLACLGPPSPARGADGQAAAAGLEQARRAFDEGEKAYTLGDYASAVRLFRESFELSRAPNVLYSLAQAHRLAGDCRRALETYRHFTRLAPESSNRPGAEAQIAKLSSICETRTMEGVPQKALRDEAPDVQGAPAAASSKGVSRTVYFAIAGGAIVAGAFAGGIYLWNDRRFDKWHREDKLLAGAAGETSANGPAWADRQDRNDRRLESIERADRIGLGFGVAAVSLLATSVALSLTAGIAPAVNTQRGQVTLQWTRALP